MKSKPQGYTLIESIMIMAVLSVLISLTVPNLSGYLLESRAKSYVHDLAVGIKYARSEAQKIAEDVHMIAINDDFNQGACITTATDCTTSAGLIYLIQAPEGLNTTFSVSQITFDRKGWRSTPSTGTVSLTIEPSKCLGLVGVSSYDLDINRTGVTNIQKRVCTS